MPRLPRILAFLAAAAAVAACDTRLDPGIGGIGRPPITAPTGEFELRAVNDTLLPHVTSNAGTNYSLVSGSFSLHADSTWLFSTVEVLTASNGTFIGNSPANYQGTWRVTDSTITLRTGYGTAKVKGDTLFWRGGPRHDWEDTLRFTLVRK